MERTLSLHEQKRNGASTDGEYYGMGWFLSLGIVRIEG
jgi:hypothetical protein